MKTYDLVVIGAGPAGLTAAVEGAGRGLSVLVVDEQSEPGGQIYRRIQSACQAAVSVLGADYVAGRELVQRLCNSRAETCFGAFVFDVSEDMVLSMRTSDGLMQVKARHIVVATGALERASPLPGWTLPGVLTAGAAQIALKSDAVVPAGRVALAGSGPLLLLVAQQLLRSGATVVAVVETHERRNTWKAAAKLPAAMRDTGSLIKGLSMLRDIRTHGVGRLTGVTDLRAVGRGRLEAIEFRHRGAHQQLPVDMLLLHHGVVPNHQLTRLLGVAHRWNAQQVSWEVVCDPYGRTSRPGVSVAGDGVNIAGAKAAEPRGALAALGAMQTLGTLSAAELDSTAAPHHRELARHQAARPFLDALYEPPDWIQQPAEETIVCRCESVSAGEIRAMAALGCAGPNQAKFFSRCGMGPCQGRVCGGTVSQLMATARSQTVGDVGAYHVRPPLKPIPLSLLANFQRKE